MCRIHYQCDGVRGWVCDGVRGWVCDGVRGWVCDGVRGWVCDGARGWVCDGARGWVCDGARGWVCDGARGWCDAWQNCPYNCQVTTLKFGQSCHLLAAEATDRTQMLPDSVSSMIWEQGYYCRA